MYCPFCSSTNLSDKGCRDCLTKFSIHACKTCGVIIYTSRQFKYCYQCRERLSSNSNTIHETGAYVKYGQFIDKILVYVSTQDSWVSYLDIANHLGLKSVFSYLVTNDSLSTIGHIVNNAKLRKYGYRLKRFKLICYNKKLEQEVKLYVRYLMSESRPETEIPRALVDQDSRLHYPNINFDELECRDIVAY